MEHPVSAPFGWQRDLPDPRDLALRHERVQALLADLRCLRRGRSWGNSCHSLDDSFAPVDSPRPSTSHAITSLVEYFDRRCLGCVQRRSRRFLDRMTRRLLHHSADAGLPLRTGFKALRRFGLPPAEFWEESGAGDEDPPAFLFSFASDFRELLFARLDSPNLAASAVLDSVRSVLAANIPIAFGFSVFDSLSDEADIPFPGHTGRVIGGHAAVAIGFDDRRWIGSDKGALRIQCAWGTQWGESGLGWLPYAFVTQQFAVDFWIALRPDWLTGGEIGRPN